MASDKQPPSAPVEGTSTPVPDGEDEVLPIAKSAEDRKAAAALSKLDTHKDDDDSVNARGEVDAEAVSRAMNKFSGEAAGKKAADEKKEIKKVKVDAADVALLVDELDMNKVKATELLKAHDGDAVRAMRAFLTAS